MSSQIKSFGGVQVPSFVIVEKVGFSVLPESQARTLEVPMKSGAYFINKKYGIRTFTVDIAIKADSSGKLMFRADDFATWLNHSQPQELIFRDKPNIKYFAVVSNAVDLSKFGRIGKGTITFICYDPFGHGTERTYEFNPTDTEPKLFINSGNAETAPLLEMTFKENVSEFGIVGGDRSLYFGSPVDVTTQTPKNLNPKLINDNFQQSTGWTQGESIEDGQIYGTLYSNGQSIRQSQGSDGQYDYGTGILNKWHGGTLSKSIGKQISDYTVEATIGMQKAVNAHVGRIEVYFLDVNGNKIGRIALVDGSNKTYNPVFHARAGGTNDGKMVAKTTSTTITKKLRDFYGVLRMTKKGKKWTAYIAQVNPTTYVHQKIYEASWTDTGNRYSSSKLAGVQIHLGAYHSYTAIKTMYFGSIRVIEHITPTVNEVDVIFEKDDILTIDNATGAVLKNGEPYFDYLTPDSKFIKFKTGANGLAVTDPVIKNGKVVYKERWL